MRNSTSYIVKRDTEPKFLQNWLVFSCKETVPQRLFNLDTLRKKDGLHLSFTASGSARLFRKLSYQTVSFLWFRPFDCYAISSFNDRARWSKIWLRKLWKEIYTVIFHSPGLQPSAYQNTKKNSMVWVRERIIPTERPPLVGEVITNFCG
jgi:hypothetical protein